MADVEHPECDDVPVEYLYESCKDKVNFTETTFKILDFSVTNKSAWDVGLTCGGRVNVYLEPIE